MSKPRAKNPEPVVEAKASLFSIRLLLALVLIGVGIAWVVYYYTTVRVDTSIIPAPKPGGPEFMQKWGKWNYLAGFGTLGVGISLLAHPSTPLGRGRGVVVGMLGSFAIGLVWIITFYVFAADLSKVWLFNDLGQFNLAVGVGFMALAFTFATRWE